MLSPTDKHMHFWDHAVIGDTVVHCRQEYRAGKSTFGVSTTVESVRLGMPSTSELPAVRNNAHRYHACLD